MNEPVQTPAPGSGLQSFAVCGEDREGHWANAGIGGDAAVVESVSVSHPFAVGRHPVRKELRGKSGFTLLMLVVVVTLIAILVALLVPAANHALSGARTGACLNNLHEISSILSAYASDNRGATVPAYDGGSFLNWSEALVRWSDGGAGYGPNTFAKHKIWRCPENHAQTYAPVGSGGGERQGSYMINGYEVTGGPAGTVNKENRYTNQRLGVFTQPSKLLMLTEGAYYSMDTKEQGLGVVPADLPADQFSGKGFNGVRYPHNQRANAVFADGHAETLGGPLTKGQFLGGDGRHAASYTLGSLLFAN